VNSFRFHDSISPHAKFLKGAEENQVKWNVLVGTVEAASHSTYGTQRTMARKEAGNSLWRKQYSASLTCQQYFLVSYRYITSTYTKYTCNIHSIYNVYPIEIFCIFRLKIFDIYGICMVYYTHNILEIYLAYTMYIIEIFCIYCLIFLYIHGICMVYVMHITSIYLPYDNNNLPGPCTLTHPILAPCTQHPPAWTYGS
jgi:hypothetical protein